MDGVFPPGKARQKNPTDVVETRSNKDFFDQRFQDDYPMISFIGI